MSRLFRLFSLILLISGSCFIPIASVFADGESETDTNELNISLSPTGTLFDISNMKPGDWAPRTIIVKNTGSKDFDYQMKLQNDGEVKLFNELLVEIKAGDVELYTGKLSEFKSLPARKLVSGNEESLDITIRFPEHLGNDFQGLSSAFTFTFAAEGKEEMAVQAMTKGMIDSGVLASSGFTLKATSGKIFNFMLIGSVLVTGGIVFMIVRHYRRMKLAQ
ncbi:hypothetical protein [Sporosarcina sp. SAFN-015]|uniref:hypothetical protein n=1 Tax=Sporosarcina sp. SAFN-015 TaxID=3387274 RepID=UPI003F7F1D83